MSRDRHDQRHRPGYRLLDSDEGKVFPNFAVTVDGAVITIRNNSPHVLLAKRAKDPFGGEWSLPGGFKRPGESLDEAITRQLLEKVGVDISDAWVRQLKAYGHPHRDPRPNVVTVVFVVLIADLTGFSPGRDVTDLELVDLAEAASGLPPTAFDHAAILEDVREYLGRQLEHEPLLPAMLGDETTLVTIRSVYEKLWDQPVDQANLRRALVPQFLESRQNSEDGSTVAFSRNSEQSTDAQNSPGRPATIWRLTSEWQKQVPPIRRPRRRPPTD